METTGYVYLRINQNYVATVRDLNSLKQYLEDVGDIDDTFGRIESKSGVDDKFLNRMYYIISLFNEKRNKSRINENVEVFRNQAYRHGVVVAASRNGFLIEYTMPNGTSALNFVKDLRCPDRYKSFSYKRAFGSHEFGNQLHETKNNLVNNPQK
jgi:hypothetical protein